MREKTAPCRLISELATAIAIFNRLPEESFAQLFIKER
jgi:hypothetical protein